MRANERNNISLHREGLMCSMFTSVCWLPYFSFSECSAYRYVTVREFPMLLVLLSWM